MKIPFNLKSIWFGSVFLSIIVYLSCAVLVLYGLANGFKLSLLIFYALFVVDLLYKIILTIKYLRNKPAIILNEDTLRINYGFRFGANEFKIDKISHINVTKKEIILLSKRQTVNLMVIDRANLQLLNKEILRLKSIRDDA